MGMNGGKTPPHKATGYALMAVGAMVMLLSMPLFVYAAVIGGLIAYVGYTLLGR
jgi:hypothetical protein